MTSHKGTIHIHESTTSAMMPKEGTHIDTYIYQNGTTMSATRARYMSKML